MKSMEARPVQGMGFLARWLTAGKGNIDKSQVSTLKG
jgi:hypothetical protein